MAFPKRKLCFGRNILVDKHKFLSHCHKHWKDTSRALFLGVVKVAEVVKVTEVVKVAVAAVVVEDVMA